MIRVKRTSGHTTCECCGLYEWEEIVISKDGKELATLTHDGHFGNGNFDPYDVTNVIQATLRAVGFESEVE